MNFEKLLGLQVFKKPQLQSVSIFIKFIHPKPPFVFVVSVIPSSRFLSDYFNVSLNLAAVPQV